SANYTVATSSAWTPRAARSTIAPPCGATARGNVDEVGVARACERLRGHVRSVSQEARHRRENREERSRTDDDLHRPEMNIDYNNIEEDIFNSTFRQNLQDELTIAFRQSHESGGRLPPASYYAAQIA